ncbi:hypothetical protein M432DRAFT_641616 [Thermoascus aurantiacus ATCC 26904]
MTAILRTFGRKRKLSSDMHSRWGDVSITSPNEGSWSQLPSNVNSGLARNADYGARHTRGYDTLEGGVDSRHRPGKSKPSKASRFISRLCSRDPGVQEFPQDSTAAIPRGHYENGSRFQSKARAERGPHSFRNEESGRAVNHTTSGEPVSKETGVFDPGDRFSSRADDGDDEASPTSNIEKALNEVPGVEENGHRHHKTAESPQDGHESRLPRTSRSPPLSVTSRMRRGSEQNTATGQTASSAGTTSSRHTSFTSSSLSSPSPLPEPPQITKIAYNPSFRDKKHSGRSKRRNSEWIGTQELVPSYDELYG